MNDNERAMRRQLLAAVTLWNIAAESENTPRYFYRFEEVSEIESGQVSIVIGHKGTGKSAIASWIDNVNAPGNLGKSVKLSLRDFPVEMLYDFSSSSSVPYNRFTALWEYVIVSAVCSLISDDIDVDAQQLHYLKSRFKPEFKDKSFDLQEVISRGFGFPIPFLGSFSLGMKKILTASEKVAKFSERVHSFIRHSRHLKINKPYYIIFDELDEDYYDIVGNIDRFDNFRALVVGLIRASERISNEFKHEDKPIYPIVLLRKDIYQVIHFNDMGKVAYRVRDVSWARQRIHKMLAYRIARSLDPNILAKNTPPFPDQWRKLFDIDDFDKNGCDVDRLFNYIFNRSFLRPRDFISFAHAATMAAVERAAAVRGYAEGIQVRDVVEAEATYSEYLRQEVEDAMVGINPDLPETLKVISDIRKKIFGYDELKLAVEARSSDLLLNSMPINKIIETLYYFNVIGRHVNKYDGTFAYHKTSDKVNNKWDFIVHRGFWREFQLSRGDVWELKGAIRAPK